MLPTATGLQPLEGTWPWLVLLTHGGGRGGVGEAEIWNGKIWRTGTAPPCVRLAEMFVGLMMSALGVHTMHKTRRVFSNAPLGTPTNVCAVPARIWSPGLSAVSGILLITPRPWPIATRATHVCAETITVWM